MSEQTQETELKTIQIGDTTYDATTVTEQGVTIINDIRRIEGRISQLQLDISIMQMARSRLMETLDEEVKNFTAIKTTIVTED